MRKENTKFYILTKKIAKHGHQAVIIIPKSLQQKLRPQTIVAYIGEQTKGLKQKGVQLVQNMDREHEAVSYTHEIVSDGYRKHSSLWCKNGSRYTITAISEDRGEPVNLNSAIEALSSDIKADEKLKKLARKLDARYIRIREYQAGQLVNDMEASN